MGARVSPSESKQQWWEVYLQRQYIKPFVSLLPRLHPPLPFLPRAPLVQTPRIEVRGGQQRGLWHNVHQRGLWQQRGVWQQRSRLEDDF